MSRSRRSAILSCAVLAALLTMPGSAFGQATRTWISGVGDDANPCSRTAPCKTWAGAISKTANGGEIDALDPGGFGPVTITKSISMIAEGQTGGIVGSGGSNSIVVNAAATDRVYIKGLDINGTGTGSPAALAGVKVLSAGRVVIRDSSIYHYMDAVLVAPTVADVHVDVVGNELNNNGIGVFVGPGSAGGTNPVVTLRNNDIHDNRCGAVAASRGGNGSTPNGNTSCGAGTSLGTPTTINAFSNGFNDDNLAIFSTGPQANINYGSNDISGNITGTWREDSGTLTTFGDNHVVNNGQNTAPNATATTSRRRAVLR